jgi:hypothetical protein
MGAAFFVREHQPTSFQFPKVASTEWKFMFMRMRGNPDWRVICVPRSPKKNKIKTLQDCPLQIATSTMTSPPEWTKAAVFREPKERVLPAFLDKAVNAERLCLKVCCENLPDENLTKQRVDNRKKVDCFLHFVTEHPKKCHDTQWEPQVVKIDSKWWPCADVIGHQSNLLVDSQRALKMLCSKNRDEGEEERQQSSAWDRRGTAGWGAPGHGCENRTHAFLEEKAVLRTNMMPEVIFWNGMLPNLRKLLKRSGQQNGSKKR